VLVGHQDTLVALQNDLARAVIGRLGLQLTPAEARRLDQYRTTDLDAYRRLLEAEGGTASALPPPPSGEGPGQGESRWLGPRAAWADDRDRARVDIIAFLDRYRRAIEGGETDALAAFYVEFPPEQRDALVRYFASVKDLRVGLDEVDVEVVGDEAIVSYTRTDDFVDVRTGRTMHVMTRPTKLLRRHGAEWRLAPGP
jgi:ketosteroid isomerase-like protein